MKIMRLLVYESENLAELSRQISKSLPDGKKEMPQVSITAVTLGSVPNEFFMQHENYSAEGISRKRSTHVIGRFSAPAFGSKKTKWTINCPISTIKAEIYHPTRPKCCPVCGEELYND